MTPLKRYLIILLFIGLGIGFGIGFGAVFYHIRKKKDDQISMGGSIKNIIIPSIFFWVAIGILIIVKMEYCIPVQMFILSGIVLAGFLSAISIPTLIINAQNDPFLSPSCYPIELAKKLDQVFFEFPQNGGHVGFMCADSNKRIYSETRAVEFICQDS